MAAWKSQQFEISLECARAANFLRAAEVWNRHNTNLQHGFLGWLSGGTPAYYRFGKQQEYQQHDRPYRRCTCQLGIKYHDGF
ncbi:hypothetical protein D3C84_1047860 [compost metagenome]